MRKRRWRAILLLGMVAGLLAACAGRSQMEPYHRTTPYDYYLYRPAGYSPTESLQLFVALHGEDQDSYACLRFWKSYADSVGFILLCPSLPVVNGSIDSAQAQSHLGPILQTVYTEMSVRDQFFLAGYSQGGEVALAYAYQYPSAVSGVSVISAARYPPPAAAASGVPILITVGDQDTTRAKAAKAYADQLAVAGFKARLVVLPGVDHSLSSAAGRVTVDLLQ